MIPYGRQDITDEDVAAVEAVLRSDFLTQGPAVPSFEQAAAEACGAKFALAVNSATSALHIACLALGLKEGDWLWTSPNTFVASSNCALYCGAKVDFVDIDPRTYNMSVDRLQDKLEIASQKGVLPKIVVAVHFAGQSCEMKRIRELGHQYGYKVIEDASHAIGGRYLDSAIGSCKYSDATVFSFHPVKIVTTGEGGMVTTQDDSLAAQMELLRSHGISRNPDLMTQMPDGPWYYQQIELGFNYRMTDIQAALGTSQMKRINEYVQKRHNIADRYNNDLKNLPLILPYQMKETKSAFHLYVIRLKLTELKKSRLQIFNELRRDGVGVNVHYIPVHLQPYYRNFGFNLGDFPNSESYYSEAISLPIFPTLKVEEQNNVIETLKRVLLSR